MKKAWQTLRLEEVCHEITDGSHFSPKTVEHGYPYVTVRDINNDVVDFSNCKFIAAADYHELLKGGCRPNKGDVLFSKDGTVGKVALIDYEKDFVVLSSLAIVRPDNSRIDSGFLKWVLKSPAFLDEAVGKKTGAAIRRIILRNLKSICVPVPPLTEQQRISRLLDEAFTGLATAQANADKNCHNARAIFESHLQSAFAHHKGWVETTIGEVCDITHGFAFDGAEFSNDVPEGNPLVITPGNFTEDGTLLFNERNTKRFSGETPAGFTFVAGDLVVVMTDLSSKMKLLGKPAFVETDNVLHNQRIGRVVFSSERIEKRLLYFFMMTYGFLKNIKMSATGTMVKHTAPKRILGNVIPFPEDRKEQLAIIAKLDDLREETQRLASLYERKVAALEALTQSLLHQAFSGVL